MFCQCDADYFGKKPNTNTCPVCLGLPGALPVPNKQAVQWAIKIGQALGCKINTNSKFDRKHYFYPDLPKGYQISQFDAPLAEQGKFEIRNPCLAGRQAKSEIIKTFGITRVHLEEDTAKLVHEFGNQNSNVKTQNEEGYSLVDFNRSGVPLVEIVTDPDFDNAEDVKIFLEELHTIIRYLGVSDADMEKGSMRMEPNISLRKILISKSEMRNNIKNPNNKAEFELPKYKVEIKNINSFNFAKKAIEYELTRQAKILDKGEVPAQETRGYDEKKGITYSQRSKEDAHDYRYFPEPDIPTMTFDNEELEMIKDELPELPSEKVERFVKDYGVKAESAFILTRDVKVANYYEKVISEIRNSKSLPRRQAGEILNKFEIHIANFIINKKLSKDLSPKDFVGKFIEMNKPIEVDNTKLAKVIENFIANSQNQVQQYKEGKTGLLGFFVGQVMKEMKGQANARIVKEMLESKLK